MKAVIVDLQEQKAAVLCEDGSVRQIPDMGYVFGQTIELPDAQILSENSPADENPSSGTVYKKRIIRHFNAGRIAAAAAACFLTLGIGAGTVWAMPYGKVYMENGSTISYTINRFDYVLEVEAESEDGEELLEDLDLEKIVHKKIDSAVEQTLAQMEQDDGQKTSSDGSSAAGGGKIEIVTDMKDEKHANKIKERLNKITEASAAASSLHEKEEKKTDIPEGTDERGEEKSESGMQDSSAESRTVPAGKEDISNAEKQRGASSEENSGAQDDPLSKGKDSSGQAEEAKEEKDAEPGGDQASDNGPEAVPSAEPGGEDTSDTSDMPGHHPHDPAGPPAPDSSGQQGGACGPGGPF